MFRKILVMSIIFIAGTSVAFALRLYVKPSFSYLSTKKTSNPSIVYAPGMGAGLGQVVNKYFYVGLEGFWIPNTVPVNNEINSYKISYQYGLSLLPGILFDNTILGYLRLGMLRSNFPNLNTIASASQIGLGLEYSLSSAWGINGEYDYVRYRNTTTVGTATADQFTLGLIYQFNV